MAQDEFQSQDSNVDGSHSKDSNLSIKQYNISKKILLQAISPFVNSTAGGG